MRPAAPLGLGVGDGGMGHGLLVLAAPGRQRVADAVQRLADAGDVAVAEDRPDALDEALALLGHLHAQPAHHRLRRGQPDRSAHRFPPLCPSAHATASRAAARALSQMRAEPCVARGHLGDRLGVGDLAAIQARATSPKIVRPTAKPLTRSKPAAVSKLAASSASGASRPSTTMPRVWRSLRLDRGDGVRPGGARGHRLELPPVGPDAGGVELRGSASRWCRRRPAPTLEGMISSRNSSRLRRDGLPEPLDRRLLLGAHLGRRRPGGRSRAP